MRLIASAPIPADTSPAVPTESGAADCIATPGRPRRLGAAGAGVVIGAAVLDLVWAQPALAHGVGGRGDLPLPLWQMAWASAAAVLISFAALGVLWTEPRLAKATGRVISGPARSALRVLGAASSVLGVVLGAVLIGTGLFGSDLPATNPLPWATYIIIWVGVLCVCALVGNVWLTMSPAATLGSLTTWTGRRRDSSTDGAVDAGSSGPVAERADASPPRWLSGHRPAAALLFGFLWLELAYFDSASPRLLGWAGLVTTLGLIAGGLRWGRQWAIDASGFGALFDLVGAMAPIGREADGEIHVRPPLAGLARYEAKPGTLAMVLVVLGGTTFDGFGRTDVWQRIVDGRIEWGWTGVQTLGLIWTMVVVAVAFALAVYAMARITGEDAGKLGDDFTPSLAPIVVAYAVAHYFSLLVFESQSFLITMSDPFAKGWNLFGTAEWLIDYTIMAPSTVSWVQASAIVVGHVAAVIAAHDRSLELFDEQLAVRSQLPMLAVMVLYTVGGLVILLSG